MKENMESQIPLEILAAVPERLASSSQPRIKVLEYRQGDNLVREHINLDRREGSNRTPFRIGIDEIEYITADGKPFKITSLIPEGYTLWKGCGSGSPQSGSNYVFYRDFLDVPLLFRRFKKVDPRRLGQTKKAFTYKEKFFKAPGSFFSLFHEIGHSWIEKSLPEDERTKRLMPGLLASQEKRHENLLSHIQEERDASCYALKKILEFRRKGIDFEPQIKTEEQLRWLIYGPLISHEIDTVAKLKDQNSEKWVARRKVQLLKVFENGDFVKLSNGSIRPRRGFLLEEESGWRNFWGLFTK